MKLDSFRELLVKKTDDTSLQNLISFVKYDILADIVIESLEKMAGKLTNLPITNFAESMKEDAGLDQMMYEALSHHASRYKAALKAGRQDLANSHASKLFKIMHLGEKIEPHTGGHFSVSSIPPNAWVRNRYLNTVESGKTKGNAAGTFATNAEGWKYRGKDFEFLQSPPHSSYDNKTRRHGFTGPYPMEQIRVNGKYLDIKDVPSDELKGHEAHPFDEHPIMGVYNSSGLNRSKEEDEKYLRDVHDYGNGPHIQKVADYRDQLEAADPEAFANRGSKPSAPVHEPIAQPETSSQESAPTQVAVSAPEKKTEMTPEHQAILDSLPEEMRQSMMSMFK